jgi:hypothetical protein
MGSRSSPVWALHSSGVRVEEHDGDGLDWRPMAPVDWVGRVARWWRARQGAIGGRRRLEARVDGAVPSLPG